MVSHGIAGSSGPEISSTSAPCAASVRPATGPAITRDRSSTRMPASGRSPLGHGFGAASPIFVIEISGNPASALACGVADHCVMRAHEGDDAAAGIGRGLERLAVPLHQRGLNRVTLRLAVQHLADGVAVMGKIGVQAHEAVAGFVDTGDRVPGRRRRLAVDAQITFAPAFDHGMAHIDRDVLRLAAAHLPDPGRRQPGRGDADLCGRGDAKRRRQLRLIAGQRERVERGSFAAGGGPDIGENFAGALHRRACLLDIPRNVARMERSEIRGPVYPWIMFPDCAARSGRRIPTDTKGHRCLRVIASAAKQSIALAQWRDGLLRCARNDDEILKTSHTDCHAPRPRKSEGSRQTFACLPDT